MDVWLLFNGVMLNNKLQQGDKIKIVKAVPEDSPDACQVWPSSLTLAEMGGHL